VPDAGAVLLEGVPLLGMAARKLRTGLLPQVAEVNWDVDVATLVALGRLPHQGRWGPEAEDRERRTGGRLRRRCGGLVADGVAAAVLTPDLIRQVYGVESKILPMAAGLVIAGRTGDCRWLALRREGA
jgi:ABC-type cobalamin/Fe3+-siderophores transport system ATPase subunit